MALNFIRFAEVYLSRCWNFGMRFSDDCHDTYGKHYIMLKEKVKGAAIGIDLGTTYSCAAVWFHKKNRVEIIPNEQGNKITQSCVAFNDAEILVGECAKNQIARNPTNTVFDVKRLIGSRFKDPQVQRDKESWPFKVIEGPAENPTIVVDFKGEEKNYTPAELSAIVLKKMKSAAEQYLGTEVTDAVITVPAYFNNKQREATMEAGTIAGLNVIRLINEPTAAAIAYGVDNKSDKEWDKDKTVLVFDLGGGTFDVSLLTVSKTGAIDVKAVGGDTHLGGEDFDTTLVNYCIKEFERKHNEDLRENPRALGRLKVACEKAKSDLSSTTFSPIEIDCLYKGIDFSIKISRAKFEELNAAFFDKCIKLVDNCLIDGGIQKKNVDEVVVVGGSTRIPKVQRMLEEYFGGKTLCKNMNGDEAVAFGAAVMAAKVNGNDYGVTRDVMLLDVTPLSLGIKTKKGGEKGYMSVIIPRNTSIPTSNKRIFPCIDDYFDAITATIEVYQGESETVKNNTLLGKFTIYDLTVGDNGRSEIEVCFEIDVNGVLQVYAEDTTTHQRKSITITYG